MTAALRVVVRIDGDTFTLDVHNSGDTDVRLWRQSNSWGWPMPRVLVADAPDSTDPVVLHPAAQLWTRNFPASDVVAPGASTRYLLRPNDIDDRDLDDVRSWVDQPVWVQAELRCEPSPEADEHGVWCGVVTSDVVRLDPPQRWLPTTS